MKKDRISPLRYVSRKLIRELGMLQLNKAHLKKTPQHWHALIEIGKEPNITISKLGHLLLLSTSAMSRIVSALIENDLVSFQEGSDKREKYLRITKKGELEVANIDEFSNTKIKGAFEFLTEADQDQIINAIEKYASALEKSRCLRDQVKIHRLSTPRTIRKQIITMIETIQKGEFSLPITDDINACILRAEEDFYYNNSYNFWYATDKDGTIIGSIGLKKIDDQTAEIKKFFIHQSYRGKSVAPKLMNALIKSAVKHRFDRLYLGTVDKFQAAHRFYEKYGFVRLTKQELPSGFEICPVDTVFFKVNVESLDHKLSQILT
ncbi:MAG: MarR family transcriptional regulator [Proteobacteria bacterium]|nr:MarR family transcriptional regulator [Pseudomonadota bacterium]